HRRRHVSGLRDDDSRPVGEGVRWTGHRVSLPARRAAAGGELIMSKTVGVIGASKDRNKVGNKALRAFESRGYTVVPINPNEREVEGHRSYPTVLDYPGPIEMATVYVPATAGVEVMDQIARKQIPEVWLNP